jgi:predicted MFS family arabinose efflux permease
MSGLLSFVLRRSLEESPEFQRMKQLASRQPFKEILKTHLWPVALGVAVLAATGAFTGLFFSYMSAYASGVLGYDPRQAVIAQTIGVIVHAMGIFAVGALAERMHPRLLLRAGSLALVVLAFPFFTALSARTAGPTLLMVVAGLCGGLINGSFAVLLTDLFPTRVRFSGVALGFNVAFTLFSGTAPLVATSLIRSTGLVTAPALVMVACGLLTFLGSFPASKEGGYVLRGSGVGHSGAPRGTA